jgi:FtsZ-binding cell division protein ZapB
MSDDIRVSPTEPEIADVLLALHMFPTLALTVRRLAFERDRLRDENGLLHHERRVQNEYIANKHDEDAALRAENAALQEKLDAIVSAYDAAHGRGSLPVTDAYFTFVAAIDAAREEEQ